jgi:hypothetical protein
LSISQIEKDLLLKLYPTFDCVHDPHFDISSGRWYIIIYKNKTASERRKIIKINLARALMQVKLGRLLNSNETADHIDEDKSNDNIDNLQILTLAENTRKSKGGPAKIIELICDNCSNKFIRLLKRHKKSKSNFCNRTCFWAYQKTKYEYISNSCR